MTASPPSLSRCRSSDGPPPSAALLPGRHADVHRWLPGRRVAVRAGCGRRSWSLTRLHARPGMRKRVWRIRPEQATAAARCHRRRRRHPTGWPRSLCCTSLMWARDGSSSCRRRSPSNCSSREKERAAPQDAARRWLVAVRAMSADQAGVSSGTRRRFANLTAGLVLTPRALREVNRSRLLPAGPLVLDASRRRRLAAAVRVLTLTRRNRVKHALSRYVRVHPRASGRAKLPPPPPPATTRGNRERRGGASGRTARAPRTRRCSAPHPSLHRLRAW